MPSATEVARLLKPAYRHTPELFEGVWRREWVHLRKRSLRSQLRWITRGQLAEARTEGIGRGASGGGWRRGWDSNPRAGYPTNRFRGDPVTTTSVPLRTRQSNKAKGSAWKPAPDDARPARYRRARKNLCTRSAHSAISTPDTTTRRWLSAGKLMGRGRRTRARQPSAPARRTRQCQCARARSRPRTSDTAR